VKTVHSSNVGLREGTKTLWVFGAGASFHMEFPLSRDFFSKSVGICTAKLETFSGKDGRCAKNGVEQRVGLVSPVESVVVCAHNVFSNPTTAIAVGGFVMGGPRMEAHATRVKLRAWCGKSWAESSPGIRSQSVRQR